MKLFFMLLFSHVVVIAVSLTNPLVSTPLGQILGSTLESRLKRTIYSFRGIRYAEAPVGELRFKPPVPVSKWTGIYNATVDGPACPQPDLRPVSEDCLFLNVYTTKLPDGGNHPKQSVIIFLHPGAFYMFTGRSDWFGPQYLLDKDVVLVTLNYRLGSLGFISTGTEEAPGNNGLKDQVVAFKWVRDNIASFGGDPNAVTLFGYSAGGFSISLHLISPMSRGLFHKAIISSGSFFGQYPIYTDQLNLAKKQARLVGCNDTVSPKEMLECLTKVPAEVLGDSLKGFQEVEGIGPVIIWEPVIEKDFGQERFLAENPYVVMKRGDFVQVPVMTGITKDEFGFFAWLVVSKPSLLVQLNLDFKTLAPIIFIYERGTQRSEEISAALKKFYFGYLPITIFSVPGLSKIFQDSITGFGTNRGTNLISQNSSKPVYYYEFAYQGRFSLITIPLIKVPFGVFHGDDSMYLFYISTMFPFFKPSDPETVMVEKWTTIISNFAIAGNPTPKNDSTLGMIWEPHTVKNKNYLHVDKTLTMRRGLHQERYDLWDKLFPF